MKDSTDREDVDISAAGARQSASCRAAHHGEKTPNLHPRYAIAGWYSLSSAGIEV